MGLKLIEKSNACFYSECTVNLRVSNQVLRAGYCVKIQDYQIERKCDEASFDRWLMSNVDSFAINIQFNWFRRVAACARVRHTLC